VPARSDTVTLVAVAASVAATDQLTKYIVGSAHGPGRIVSRVELAGGWLALEYTENRGAAFGLLSGLAPILAVTSLAVLAGLLLHYMQQARPPFWQTMAIGGIAGGAVGNLLDRFRLGYVIDFLSVGPWPNFNVADSAITMGILVLIWSWSRPPTAFGMPRAIDQGG
jgi:signal peptidase II